MYKNCKKNPTKNRKETWENARILKGLQINVCLVGSESCQTHGLTKLITKNH